MDYLIDYKDYFPFRPNIFLESDVVKDFLDISYIHNFINEIISIDDNYARIQTSILKYPNGTVRFTGS